MVRLYFKIILILMVFMISHMLIADTSNVVLEYDVVIYGGTSAGVSAAVQTARMGKSVILIEPGSHLGGLSSGGLGQTDI